MAKKGVKNFLKNLVDTDELKKISSDGFQAKDLLSYGKLVAKTEEEAVRSVARGILSTGENIGDYAAYHTASGLQKLGVAPEYMEEVKRSTTDSLTNQLLAPVNKSLLGTSGKSVLEGVGNSLGNMAIGGQFGGAATYGSMFLSSAGAATTQKYGEIDTTLQQLEFQKSIATDKDTKDRLQAEIDNLSKNKDKYINTYATISGLAEMGSEAMFGGIAKGLKLRGIGTGAEDDLIRYATKNISNMLARNLISAGISATGEGIEEIMSDFGEALAQKASTEKDTPFIELLADQDWLGDFMNGFMSSLITQGGETIKASRSGIDITTGLTQTESDVVKELAKEQQAKDGGKLSDIERDIENKLKEGTIKYEDIQRVLSKDTYNELDTLKGKQRRISELESRIKELDKNPNEKLTSLNEYNSTKEELNQLKNEDYSRIDELTERLENETNELTKGKDGNMSGAFAQSYLDRQNRGVAYQVDEDTYNKASKELQGLYDSARRIMNNTVQARKFIDSMAKLSKSNGLNYQMTNNQELKELGKTVDGKVVNGLGYRTENGNTILINVDAADNLNTILGHETTHFTETAGNYKDYQKFLQKNFKDEYNALKEKYESIYEGLDADIDSEITAQLTGEKLFNDPKFIEKLTEKPTLFNKIKNFIDDLVTKFAGTKEEKQLKDLQKRFQEVYDKTDFKKKRNGEYSLAYAKTAELDNTQLNRLEKAVELKKDGLTNEEIWKKTGVVVGDSLANTKIYIPDLKFKDTDYLKQVFKMDKMIKLTDIMDGELFNIYPQLKNTSIGVGDLAKEAQEEGKSESDIKTLQGVKGAIDNDNNIILNSNIKTLEEAEGIISHEVQHIIQVINGLDENTSEVYKKQGEKAYKLHPQEIEAEVNRVLNSMSNYERKNITPQSIEQEIKKYYEETGYKGLDINKVINRLRNKHGIQYSLSDKKINNLLLTNSDVYDMVDSRTLNENGLSVNDLISRGLDDIDKLETAWRKANYENSSKNFHEVPIEEAVSTIRNNNAFWRLSEGWFRGADSAYKPNMEKVIIMNPELRNAGINIAYQNYKDYINKDISFDDFINKEITLYRGSNDRGFVDDDKFIAFSYRKDMVEKHFANRNKEVPISEIKVKIKDTLGSYQTTGEAEVLVPRSIADKNDIRYSLSQDSEGKSLNEDQKEFFKNVSPEVIDDNGNLMRFYHGSNSKFTVFDITKAGESNKSAKVGFWFAPLKSSAENFASDIWYGDNTPTTYEVYLKLENPKIYEYYDDTEAKEQVKKEYQDAKKEANSYQEKYAYDDLSLSNVLMYKNYRGDEGTYNTLINDYKFSDEKAKEILEDANKYIEARDKYSKLEKELENFGYTDAYEQFRTDIYKIAGKTANDANFGGIGMALDNENQVIQDYVKSLKEQGYDGIVIKNTRYDASTMGGNNDQYVVFEPNQIKNVDNLHPTDNPDIRYSLTDDKGRTLTQDQQIFYSNSVVRDKDGNLKTYYNGSDNFNIFNRNFMSDSSKWGKGIYLTEHEDIAKNYGKDLKEVYVNITNPLNERRKTITFDQYNALYQRLYDGEEAYREEYDMYDNDLDLLWDMTNKGSWADYAEIIKETTGKDGLIIDRMDDVEDMIIAFQSNQVKRVNNLTPTEDPDIRYSLQNQNEQLAPYNPNGIYGQDVRLENQQVRQDIDTLRDIAPIRTDTDEEGDTILNADIERDIAPTMVIDTQPVPEGKGRSSYWQNVGKQDFLTEEAKELIQDEDDVKYYDVVSNKETLAKANEKLQRGGLNEALNWSEKFQLDEKGKVKSKVTAEDVAEGWILMKNYQDEGNYDAMISVAKTMRNMGTEAGQAVQAYNIMSRMTPEGMVKFAQSELTEAFNKASKNKSKEWIDLNSEKFDLTPDETKFIVDTMNEVQNMEDGYEKKVKLAQIQSMLNNKIPTNIGNEIKSWMRISMLFNPKTQVRNVVGNAIITPVNAVSDFISSAADKFISRKSGVRTTGNANIKAYLRGMKRGAYEATNDYKLGINTKDVNMDRFEAGQGKSFTEKTPVGKALNYTEGLLNYVMDVGDRLFSEAAFENSLQNQMVLNNTTEATQEMIDIARTEALQRTWNDNNNYTKFVLDVRKALNRVNFKGYGLGDVLIPFAKTPANLTKAIVDYSPVGMINTLKNYNNLRNSFNNGQYSAQLQHEFVQTLGKATAGTMLYVLGYALAKAGISSGKSDEDKDVANFLKNTLGISSYSINVGGKSYTYDWAQPIAAPLSITANMVSSKDDKQALVESIVANLDTAGSILMEQSFLQSINETLNNNSGFVNGLIDETLDLPARAIPTFSKQIADLTDDTQRQTFEYNRPVETAINKIKAKIPGLSQDLAPVVDTMGREVKRFGGKNNIFNVFLNPANVNTENISESAQEIYDLYKSTGDKTIMPRVAPYYLNKSGEKIVLSSQQKAEYQTVSGGIIESQVQGLMNNSQYQSMSDAQKSSVVKNIVDYAYNVAQHEVLGLDVSQNYEKPYLYSKVGDVNNWYLLKSQNFTADKDEDGNSISGSKKNKVARYIDNMNISTVDKAILLELNGYSLKYYDEDIYNYINSLNISYEDKTDLWYKMGHK